MLIIYICLHLLHKVCGNQAANANLTPKNSPLGTRIDPTFSYMYIPL
jgi:hypothetical protein